MRSHVVLLLLFLAFPAFPGSGSAQSEPLPPQVGVGYVTNAPNQFLGFSGHALSGRFGGIGIYIDAKFDTTLPRDEDSFFPDLTARQVQEEMAGQTLFQEEFSYRSVNAALLRPVSSELILYAGAGVSERTAFVEFFDQERTMGRAGYYWVEDPEAGQTGANVLLGGFFRISSRLWLQFGVETAPRGATVGATYAIPLPSR